MYADCSIWSEDQPALHRNAPLRGPEKGSDRGEVRAMVAAVECGSGAFDVVTDSTYVKDKAAESIMGGGASLCTHQATWDSLIVISMRFGPSGGLSVE